MQKIIIPDEVKVIDFRFRKSGTHLLGFWDKYNKIIKSNFLENKELKVFFEMGDELVKLNINKFECVQDYYIWGSIILDVSDKNNPKGFIHVKYEEMYEHVDIQKHERKEIDPFLLKEVMQKHLNNKQASIRTM